MNPSSLKNTEDESVRLTSREIEILGLISQGHQSREAAEILFVSKRTIDFHLANVYTKLKARNRINALRKAQSLGLIPAEPSLVSMY